MMKALVTISLDLMKYPSSPTFETASSLTIGRLKSGLEPYEYDATGPRDRLAGPEVKLDCATHISMGIWTQSINRLPAYHRLSQRGKKTLDIRIFK